MEINGQPYSYFSFLCAPARTWIGWEKKAIFDFPSVDAEVGGAGIHIRKSKNICFWLMENPVTIFTRDLSHARTHKKRFIQIKLGHAWRSLFSSLCAMSVSQSVSGGWRHQQCTFVTMRTQTANIWINILLEDLSPVWPPGSYAHGDRRLRFSSSWIQYKR